MCWVIAFKIHVLDALLFEEMPNRSSSEIWGSFLSWVFSPILWRLSKSVLLSSRQWIAVLMSSPQLQIGLRVSWKLCQNLCSRRWLRPNLSLVINLIPLGLWQLKLEFEDGLINFKKLFLKAEKVLEFLFFKSKSFHSVTVDGKKKNL